MYGFRKWHKEIQPITDETARFEQEQGWSIGSLVGPGDRRRGAPLVLRRGKPSDVLQKLIKETGAKSVYWNRCYEPWRIRRDRDIKQELAHAANLTGQAERSLVAAPDDECLITNLFDHDAGGFQQF